MKEYYFETYAMGGEVSVCLVTESSDEAQALWQKMKQELTAYEQQFSRFIPTSELSRVNSTRTTTVTPEFLNVFTQARELYQKTAGAYNPLVSIERFGYNEDIKDVRINPQRKRQVGAYTVSIDEVICDTEASRLSLPDGATLDFNGFLKGYVAEKLALMAHECKGVIVNLSGDLYTLGTDAEGDSFLFSIESPRGEYGTEYYFQAQDTAIATSGTYRRFWDLNGQKFHHILDQTGLKNPHTDILSATILSKKGGEADALASAAVVWGSDKAQDSLESFSVSYYLQKQDGSSLASSFFTRSLFAEPHLAPTYA